jgi:iron complex transport system substrate-binding protein
MKLFKSLGLMTCIFSGFIALPGFANAANLHERLVTVDGAITETVFALGSGDQINAVDTTSTYPDKALSLPKVGYIRALTSEGIMALSPSLVLTNQDAGPKEALEQLTNLGVKVQVIETEFSIDGVKALITQVGVALDKTDAAQALVRQLENSLQPLLAKQFDKTVMFVMNGGDRGLMVAGKGTRADALIQLSGATNAFANLSGYKPLSAEAVMMVDPDVILLMHSDQPLEKWLHNSALQHTHAAKHNGVFIIDGLDLLTFGPRLPNAIAHLQGWLEK